MKLMKNLRTVLAIVLTVIMIIGFMPSVGVGRVEAAESNENVTIYASKINEGDGANGAKWYLDDEGGLIVNLNYSYSLYLDASISLPYIYQEWQDTETSGGFTISGSQKLVVEVIELERELTINGANITAGLITSWGNVSILSGSTINATQLDVNGADLTISNSTVSVSNSDEYAIAAWIYGDEGGKINITNSTVTSIVDDPEYGNIICHNGINLNNCYIKTPANGKVDSIVEEDNFYSVNEIVSFTVYHILDSNGKIPAKIEIVPGATPETTTKTTTPASDNSSNTTTANPKSYKNEWVDGQWYDANGKTTYSPKGSWKKNSIGWWYEDTSGWFPTARWQKIDGDWYYFNDIGYMAENEYAGNWSAYSEGYWWVGADGAWDGSEPGVWRLSGTKWWFKDSTGWFAKNNWYKIGGNWYKFDAEGWWDENAK